jgi:hypothetical protein
VNQGSAACDTLSIRAANLPVNKRFRILRNKSHPFHPEVIILVVAGLGASL